MRYIFTLLLIFLTFFFAEAQKTASKATTPPTRLDTARFNNLEKQVKAQHLVLNKQKAALDSLVKEVLVLKARQEDYSNDVTTSTALFSVITTLAIFMVGFILPNLTFNKTIKEARAEFAKAISNANKDFKTSLEKAVIRIQDLEEKVLNDIKELKVKSIGHEINTNKTMMLITLNTWPSADIYMMWALTMYKGILKYSKAGGKMTDSIEFGKDMAIRNFITGINRPVEDLRSQEKIITLIQEILQDETEEEYINRVKKLNEGYNKLYYASLAKKKEEEEEKQLPT